MLLKGAALFARSPGTEGKRRSADYDFLVFPGDLGMAGRFLERRGFLTWGHSWRDLGDKLSTQAGKGSGSSCTATSARSTSTGGLCGISMILGLQSGSSQPPTSGPAGTCRARPERHASPLLDHGAVRALGQEREFRPIGRRLCASLEKMSRRRLAGTCSDARAIRAEGSCHRLLRRHRALHRDTYTQQFCRRLEGRPVRTAPARVANSGNAESKPHRRSAAPSRPTGRPFSSGHPAVRICPAGSRYGFADSVIPCQSSNSSGDWRGGALPGASSDVPALSRRL